jgi:hypothetical protein
MGVVTQVCVKHLGGKNLIDATDLFTVQINKYTVRYTGTVCCWYSMLYPPSSPYSPHVSRSGPCALYVLVLSLIPYCSYVTARSGPNGPQHALRYGRSKWPATYSIWSMPYHTYAITNSLYIVMSTHPHTHPLCSYLHVSPPNSRGASGKRRI